MNVVPLTTALEAARPNFGYRRITAILNRQLRATGASLLIRERFYRIMQTHNLLLARRYTEWPDHAQYCKVVTMRSNMRSPVGSSQWRLTGSLFRRLRVRLPE